MPAHFRVPDVNSDLHNVIHGLLACIVPALTTACEGREAGHPARVPVRDSAGIEIVENERPAAAPALGWRVGDSVVLSIGVLEGEEPYNLYGVEDATRFPDGRIAVANSGSGEIRVFAPDGTHLLTMGGIGEGPGEFERDALDGVSWWPGDSIMASSASQKQVAVFDAAGRHGRTFGLSSGHDSIVGVLRDGTLLAHPRTLSTVRPDPHGPPIRRWGMEYGLLLPNGELRASLGTHPGEEWSMQPAKKAAGLHPFGRTTLSAVWGELAVVTPNDRYEIRAYRSDGALARIVRLDHELRVQTRAHLEAWVSGMFDDLPEDARRKYRRMAEGIPLLESFPAFSAIQSDRLGYLWVREYNLPGEYRHLWVVFGPDGLVEGLAETPPGLRIFEIEEDHVLVKTRDEMGVERVELRPLDRGPGWLPSGPHETAFASDPGDRACPCPVSSESAAPPKNDRSGRLPSRTG